MTGPINTAMPQPPALVEGLRILRGWLGVSPTLVLLAILAVAAITASTLSLNRLCFADMSFLSRQAAIDAWADRLIAVRRQSIRLYHRDENLIELRPVDVIPYRDRDDFYTRNPGCCTTLAFAPELPAPNYWDLLWGKWAYIASATSTVNYIDRDGTAKSTTITAMAPVTNCGRPWRGF